jgi:hypothetical protein
MAEQTVALTAHRTQLRIALRYRPRPRLRGGRTGGSIRIGGTSSAGAGGDRSAGRDDGDGSRGSSRIGTVEVPHAGQRGPL